MNRCAQNTLFKKVYPRRNDSNFPKRAGNTNESGAFSREVHTFFTKAKEVSAIAIHNEYDYLPCYVKGTILRKSSPEHTTCDFSIRAGGTAELACKGEEIKFYGCKTCDN